MLIETLMDTIEWKPCNNLSDQMPSLPYVTHEGVLTLGDFTVQVVMLNTGERIIPETELEKIFGVNWKKETQDLIDSPRS